ncbi:NAD(P)H-dependent oxidoreductase [Arcanobacterium haemolyticum]|nr:NAD(P)H-dependent oxidoreductase [Arcanobacterium haemolyticum]
MKIVYLVGSLAKDSINRGLSKALVANAPEGVELVEFPIADLPVYNRDFDADFPQVAKDLKAAIEGADGIVLVTPEHNRMYSAALHNALEWSSRPWGSMSLAGKPVATIGASPSGIGTAAAQQHLRSTLVFFGSKVMGQPEGYIDAIKAELTPEGSVNDGAKKVLADWVAAFAAFVDANK